MPAPNEDFFGMNYAYNNPNIGGPAQNAQTSNQTNIYRQRAADMGQSVGTAGPTDAASRARYNYEDYPGIPPDIQNLRTRLSAYLSGRMREDPAQYARGGFDIGTPTGMPMMTNLNEQMLPMMRGMGLPGESALDQLTQYTAPGVDIGPLMGMINALRTRGPGSVDINDINSVAGQGFNAAMDFGRGAVGNAQMYGSNAWNAANQYGTQAAGALGAAMPVAQDIAQTGGIPIQMLLHSINAINQSGQLDINSNLAAIRERYGAQGLGAGSDINTALGLGATQGQAQIEAQQSSLLTNILQQASATQLGGVNALQGISSGYGNIGNLLSTTALGAGNLVSGTQLGAGNLASSAAGMAGGLYAQGQGLSLEAQRQGLDTLTAGLNPMLAALQLQQQGSLGSANVRLGAAQALPAYMGAQQNAYNSATGNLLNMAGLSQQANLYQNQQQYQDFLRMQQLTPAQQAAMGFATSYPPINANAGGGGFPWGSAIGAGGMIAAAMLSDRNAKENIVPIDSALERLKKLPIYRWNYKGDSVPHIGPMAQDFRDTFGVGDGHMIHLVDVMGVLLQSMKDLGERVH